MTPSKDKRTDQQRKAIEVLCRRYADALNDAGFDKVAVLSKKAIPVSWNQDAIKEDLFKAVMRAICYNDDGSPKESTTELETDEVSLVHKHLDKWIATEFGISIPFPSQQDIDHGH